jgi:hypothetical protein
MAFALQLRKSAKYPSHVSLKVLVGYDLMCRNGSLLQVAKTSCQYWSPCFRGPGSTLGQSRYLPSSVTKRFFRSAKFVSNTSVRHATAAIPYYLMSNCSLRFYALLFIFNPNHHQHLYLTNVQLATCWPVPMSGPRRTDRRIDCRVWSLRNTVLSSKGT